MLLNINVVVQTEDDFDDSMALLEQQVSEALGWLGDVQTCDVYIDDPEDNRSPDEKLTEMLEDDEEAE